MYCGERLFAIRLPGVNREAINGVGRGLTDSAIKRAKRSQSHRRADRASKGWLAGFNVRRIACEEFLRQFQSPRYRRDSSDAEGARNRLKRGA